MLTVRLQVLFLIKERSSHPLEGHPLVTHPSLHIGPASSLLLLIHHLSQGPHLILEVCFHTTHIGFHCIQCVVIIICLLSLSENPCLLISPFKPYLSDPPTLLLLIHLSHNNVFHFVFPFPQHHSCITNIQRAESLPSHSHLSHITYLRYVRATLHPVLPGHNLIPHKLVSKLD